MLPDACSALLRLQCVTLSHRFLTFGIIGTVTTMEWPVTRATAMLTNPMFSVGATTK